jgi:hypothetical protein
MSTILMQKNWETSNLEATEGYKKNSRTKKNKRPGWKMTRIIDGVSVMQNDKWKSNEEIDQKWNHDKRAELIFKNL